MTDDVPCTRDVFIALSECLTGVTGLDGDLASQHFDRFREHPTFGGKLFALSRELERIADETTGDEDLEAEVGKRIMNDPDLGPAAQQLIYLWYVGAFFEADPADPRRGAWSYGANPDHYGRGLMWAVIRAHAPMTPRPAETRESGARAAPSTPYWTQPPDLAAPVTVPPRWFDR